MKVSPLLSLASVVSKNIMDFIEVYDFLKVSILKLISERVTPLHQQKCGPNSGYNYSIIALVYHPGCTCTQSQYSI